MVNYLKDDQTVARMLADTKDSIMQLNSKAWAAK